MIAEITPNDRKLSDTPERRGTCAVGGKAVVEAGAVTRRRVRCSAWLGVAVILGLIGRTSIATQKDDRPESDAKKESDDEGLTPSGSIEECEENQERRNDTNGKDTKQAGTRDGIVRIGGRRIGISDVSEGERTEQEGPTGAG